MEYLEVEGVDGRFKNIRTEIAWLLLQCKQRRWEHVVKSKHMIGLPTASKAMGKSK